MCGIVGYVGKREAQDVLLEGLRRLEYRGYDSAGIAVWQGSNIQIARCEGKLHKLVEKTAVEPLRGHCGIGHTRWATHGRPSDANAHPHTYGRVTVVHNGIIENHRQLREELSAQGETFSSETDSEILAHLINNELKKEKDSLVAVRKGLAQVDGVYAVCCVIEGETDCFFCAKKDAPLILGLGDNESFAASDIPAILHHTRKMIFLEDGDTARISAQQGIEIFNESGVSVERPIKEVAWSSVMAEKEGYKHFMLKEIYEQPRAIADTLRGRLSPKDGTVNLDGIDLPVEKIRRIFLVACGTSYHACLTGKFFLENLAKIPTEVDLASEFRYRDPLIGEGDLLVAMSQSGETADTRAALVEAKRKGAQVLAIVNVLDSSISRAADWSLYTHAGPEIGVASTKAFTTQLVALHLLALYCAQQRKVIPEGAMQTEIHGLLSIPHLIQEILRYADGIKKIANKYADASDWLYLGRGVNYPIALEGALKLKEISYIHAEGYAAGEMKHGPIALIDESLPVVGIVPTGPFYGKMMSNLQEVKARGGKLIAIATEGDAQISELADDVITIPNVAPLLQPLATVIPLQLLAYYVADAKGTDVDQPRNLAKSVTVE